MIRALVVDDEQPARERLCLLLQAFEDLEVVGEAEDGEQAIERVQALAPDLIFLDIQMPGCSGIEVAASLGSPRPKIIFCTAYDEYAVDAFELHAVDYLLKPINRARLEKALSRVRSAAAEEADGSIDTATHSAGSYPVRFLAKHSSRYCVVPSAEVLYFTSEGGQTKLQTSETHYWVHPTLGELGTRLDPERFFQISRAAIINLDAVREVLPQGSGQGEVKLTDGSLLDVSRRRFKELMERLGKS